MWDKRSFGYPGSIIPQAKQEVSFSQEQPGQLIRSQGFLTTSLHSSCTESLQKLKIDCLIITASKSLMAWQFKFSFIRTSYYSNITFTSSDEQQMHFRKHDTAAINYYKLFQMTSTNIFNLLEDCLFVDYIHHRK